MHAELRVGEKAQVGEMTLECSPASAVRNVAAGLVPAVADGLDYALRVAAELAAIVLALLDLTPATDVGTLILHSHDDLLLR
jgi:hypothetical protein